MTSLPLYNSSRPKTAGSIKSSPDWGTGKTRSKSKTSLNHDGTGSFLYTGEPTSQSYQNTDITLSNVRVNDELVPAPLHKIDTSSHEIKSEFPSNHPYASHISENAMFPLSNNYADDRPSTCADPYIVTHKIRGNPFRREVHYHGFLREHYRSFKWPDKHYMQLPRSLSDASSSSIYPWPRKMFAPNPSNSILKKTDNKQQTLKETTQESNSTNNEGLNSRILYDTTVNAMNGSNKPHMNTTFQSVRPVECMQIIYSDDNNRSSSALEEQKTLLCNASMETTNIMSENEKLDHHMRYGTDYVNLPARHYTNEQAPTWTPRQAKLMNENPMQRREVRCICPNRPSTTGSQIYYEKYANHQQMDAENRLQQLEVIRPKENINLLNVKTHALQHPRHARPILPQYRDDYVNTLYDQVGAYVQERAGLYHTDSYDPIALSQAIPELEYLHENNGTSVQNENDPNYLLEIGEQIQNRSKPKLLHERALGDYQNMRNQLLSKLRVPCDSTKVNSRVQEGNKQFVQKQTIYGQTYNTPKFLQENTLNPHARVEPTCLMSTRYNTNLHRVRSLNSFPMKPNLNQGKSNSTLASPVHYPSQSSEIYQTNQINEHTDGYTNRSTVRVYDSPFKSEQNTLNQNLLQQQTNPLSPFPLVPPPLQNSSKIKMQLVGPELVSRFIEPNVSLPTTYQRSFKPVTYKERVSQIQAKCQRAYSTLDKHYPSQNLTDLQDKWSKTKALQQYHMEHPEPVPDVGNCTLRAKKEILVADIAAKKADLIIK